MWENEEQLGLKWIKYIVFLQNTVTLKKDFKENPRHDREN